MPDYAYVAFLDILGYRNLLEMDVLAGTSVFRDKMTRAFRHFETINRSRHQYQVISDAIYITCSDRDSVREFLGHLKSIFIAFLGEGLLIRGGLTFGQHFMNNAVTYSPALTKAYKLENEVAIFPRIMVDENIVTMFPEISGERKILQSGKNWFLNIVEDANFHELWQKARATFLSDLDAIEQVEQIRIKHKWLQDYLIESATILGIDSPCPYVGAFDAHTQFQAKRQADAVWRIASAIRCLTATRKPQR